MFSTMAKKAKQPGGKRTFSQTDVAQEDTDQTLDEESDSEDNEETEDNEDETDEMRRNILENTVPMTHPTIFQNINLCEKRNGLNRYGEKKLRSMVETLELSPGGADKKYLVACLKAYLIQCPCYK